MHNGLGSAAQIVRQKRRPVTFGQVFWYREAAARCRPRQVFLRSRAGAETRARSGDGEAILVDATRAKI